MPSPSTGFSPARWDSLVTSLNSIQMVYDIQSEAQLREHLQSERRLVVTAYNAYSNEKISDYRAVGDDLPGLDFLFINLDSMELSDGLQEEFVTTHLPCISFYHSRVVRVERNPEPIEVLQIATNFQNS